jgi:hypothetical protein
VACLRSGRGIERVVSGGVEDEDWRCCCCCCGGGGGGGSGADEEDKDEEEGEWSGKWEDLAKAGRVPPSRERETWILVSLVSREMVASRRGQGSEEPMRIERDQCENTQSLVDGG